MESNNRERLRQLLDEMARAWRSPVVARGKVEEFSGGVLNGRTLANLDSLGQGPKERFRMGRVVFYSVSALIDFIRERTEGGESDAA